MSFSDIMNEAIRLQGESIKRGDFSNQAMIDYLDGAIAGMKVATESRPVTTNPATRGDL